MNTPQNKARRWWWVVLPATVLAGCVNLAPDYEKPAVPTPEGWSSAHATPPAGAVQGDALNTGWRDFFVDTRLRGAIELALANNRDLRVAALNIDTARARYGIARAAAYPTLDIGTSASRAQTSANASTNGQGRLATTYTANLGLTSYEIDFFGRVRNLGEAALQSFFATEETRRSTQISLVASVATAWLQLAADQQRLLIARNTLASQQKSYELIQRSHDLGAQSGLALAQARTTVDTARVDVAAYDSVVEQDTNALRLLVGASLPADLLPTAEAVVAGEPSTLLLLPPADLPSSVLQQRPDVLAAERALVATNANIGAARAAFYPRISLTGAVGNSSTSLSNLFDGASQIWSFAPSISIPIFNGGLSRANLQVAQVQQQIQLATYETALQRAFREVADALAERRTLSERVAAQESLLEASTRSFDLSQALFKSGSGSFLDVLIAQRSLYTVQQSLIGLRLVERNNRVTLYKVLGGGWTDSAPGTTIVGESTSSPRTGG